MGSGAVFFSLQPERAYLGDTCEELVEMYKAVRDNASAVLRSLTPLAPKKKRYYHIRGHRSPSRFRRAAEFIYLNKTCWNGLHRVNAAGQFNVPFGRPAWTRAVDAKNLHRCASALAREHVRIECADFALVSERARPGDLVYLDPPYVTRHLDNGFRAYNEILFSWEDQKRLAVLARKLAENGVHVVVSNAAHPSVRELYYGFEIHSISRTSTLAADTARRGRVVEALYVANLQADELHPESTVPRRNL